MTAIRLGRFEDDGWRTRKDGSRFWANVIVTPLQDHSGGARGFVQITRDTPEKRSAEQELVKRSAELEAANKELESFSYSVSHDLRAPLRGIGGFSQALDEDYASILDVTGRNYLARIRAGTRRMGMLIDDLVNLARVSRAEVYREKVDLTSLASDFTLSPSTAIPLLTFSVTDGIFHAGTRSPIGRGRMEQRVILLIEDNPDDEALTLRALKKNNIRNEVVVARDGVEALDYLFGTGLHAGRDLSAMPHVILLDLKLSKMDGFEVLERIRSSELTKLLPVVILTTSNEDQDRIRRYGPGANSFVRKLVEFDKFIEAVRQLGLYWLIFNEAAPVPRRP